MSRSDLSLVGQHFLIGLRPGVSLDPMDQSLLSEIQPAGVILYKSNFDHAATYPGWLETHHELIDQIRTAVGRKRLIIAIDHEGGRVCRTPPPVTRFSYAARWASKADLVGRTMGRELACLGINLNFAPVLDIHSNPDNPVIGDRAFGTGPAAVSLAATAFIDSMQAEGVLACGKHFPGHGDTSEDSHFSLPVSHLDARAVGERELRPFKAAIDSGLLMIMSSHIMFPKIDPDEPATLSARIINGLLRKQLGFDGVVVSDDIGMHAMDGYFDDPSAAVRFLAAGSDLLMVCSHWTSTERSRDFARAILQAKEDGALHPNLLFASQSRIRALLESAPNHQVAPLPEAESACDVPTELLFGGETVEVV
jgi:beta-N-acetylhexosaminidase